MIAVHLQTTGQPRRSQSSTAHTADGSCHIDHLLLAGKLAAGQPATDTALLGVAAHFSAGALPISPTAHAEYGVSVLIYMMHV